MPKYIKNAHCVDAINNEYVQLLVKIKGISMKTVFFVLFKILLPIYTTYIQHTYFIFG